VYFGLVRLEMRRRLEATISCENSLRVCELNNGGAPGKGPRPPIFCRRWSRCRRWIWFGGTGPGARRRRWIGFLGPEGDKLRAGLKVPVSDDSAALSLRLLCLFNAFAAK